jgi:hypothetical protein
MEIVIPIHVVSAVSHSLAIITLSRRCTNSIFQMPPLAWNYSKSRYRKCVWYKEVSEIVDLLSLRMKTEKRI